MADDATKTKDAATPAAQSAGLTKDDVLEMLKPLTATLQTLGENQKAIGETIAVLAKPAEPAADAKKDEKGADAKAAPLTSEAVSKLVADAIAADRKAQADEAGKKTARQQLVEKITKEKLAGDADLAAQLVGDDEAALAASADKLVTSIKKYKPDFGVAGKDGGQTVNAGSSKPAVSIGNLSEGAAKFAAGIKLPA